MNSEVEQLALTVQKGDVAVRLDEKKSYINKTGNNVSMDDWQYLETPTDAVQSVDGRVGVVTLNDLYEALFSKNTAFNKDFGVDSGDVCEGNDSRLSKQRSLLLLGDGTGLAGSQTGYLAPWGAFGVETSAQIRMPACTLKRLTIYISSNTVTGDTVYTINKNGVATGLTVTFGNVETGRKTIAADVSFADSDLLSLEAVIGGTGGQGIFYKEASVEMEG